jgi:hypothetical protein
MSAQNLEIPSGVLPVDNTKEQHVPKDSGAAIPGNIAPPADKKRIFYDSLSEIQAELEDLQTILASIRKGETIIPTYAEYIETTKTNIRDLMALIDPNELPDEVGIDLHSLRHLNNAWEQMQVSPLIKNPTADYEIQEQLHYLDLLDEQIRTFHYQISLLFIPYQINDWLRESRPGYYISFHDVFTSNVPGKEDRDRLLRYIALTPRLIEGGFVDADSGRIYRYSTNRWRRLQSLAMLVAGLGISTGVVALASILPLKNWPPKDIGLINMLVAWVAVLIGIGVHVIVGSAKRTKTQNGIPSVLMDLIMIIDARFGEIVMKLVLALIGLFGLVMLSTSPVPQLGLTSQLSSLLQVTPLNAFLVGYSLDSIIELFGTSLEGTSQVKSLTK